MLLAVPETRREMRAEDESVCKQKNLARIELISSAYPMAVPGFEPRIPDMRGERVVTTPPTHVGRIWIFTSEQANVFTLERCDS
ncbi:hypothetical protein T265_09651 [Opisthorchis viverrini]|uniref:Uncharacterized protein n=1 Tax=Opisthorchis viverrini TaxID=6198 RepID=A0A074Z565_OPIVI|nr:hypothetical protein T265_09651 [Opisthorchis viverrini]KER22198.1 hypothetical protein T265_09651 [Opisthorchis viverrini]